MPPLSMYSDTSTEPTVSRWDEILESGNTSIAASTMVTHTSTPDFALNNLACTPRMEFPCFLWRNAYRRQKNMLVAAPRIAIVSAGRLFGGRLVVFPGGDIVRAVRGVVLSAFPGYELDIAN